MTPIVDRTKLGRAVVVSTMIPPASERDLGGTQRRMGLFLKVLASRFEQVEVVHIVPPALMARALDSSTLDREQSAFWGVPVRIHLVDRRTRRENVWNHYGAGLFAVTEQHYFRSYGGDALAQAIRGHLHPAPDFILIDHLNAMLPILRGRMRPSRLLLDLNDVEHKLRISAVRTKLKSPLQFAALMQVPSLVVAEFQAVQRSAATTVCSQVDRAHLRRLGFGPKVEVLPNAVALPPNPPGLVRNPTVLFLGACDYQPNFDAAERLARRIWPVIRERAPEARLILAGKGTNRLPSRSEGIAGIEYRGFVPDLTALYAETRVVCCPLVAGSGTRLKLVEAAAYARPMVSTRLGAEGLDFADGIDILLRETDREIGDACAFLLCDDASSIRLGNASRAKMAVLYDSRLIERQIDALVAKIVGR